MHLRVQQPLLMNLYSWPPLPQSLEEAAILHILEEDIMVPMEEETAMESRVQIVGKSIGGMILSLIYQLNIIELLFMLT